LGVGFGGFWIGRLANIPWTEQMTWTLGQAHSGYVDTYLQIGLIGVLLLAAVIASSLPRLVANLRQNFDLACFRITMLLTVVYVNLTETTFLRGDHHMWFVTMLVLWILPSPEATPVQVSTQEPTSDASGQQDTSISWTSR
jgi:O-antigen ligase